MKTDDFQKLLGLISEKLVKLAAEGRNGDYGKVYTLLTWWTDEYRIIFSNDIEHLENGKYVYNLIASDQPCQMWKSPSVPCPFILNLSAVRPKNAVSMANTFDVFANSDIMLKSDEVKFLIRASPVNQRVDIDPLKTKIIFNPKDEIMVAFYVSYKDSGEWITKAVDKMTADRIKVVDERLDTSDCGFTV